MVDLSPLVNYAVAFGAGLLSIAGSAALGFLAQKFHVQVSEAQTAQWDGALNKALSYGGMQAQALIKAHGYDHVEVQNAIIAQALTYMVNKFPQALKSQGISADLSKNDTLVKVEDALKRALPGAMTAFAASPATPNQPAL